jgi:flagellar assembly protein FliH
MANSSEWLGALAAPEPVLPPWLMRLGEEDEPGFRSALPFGGPEPEAPPPAPAPAPPPAPDFAPDPLALAYAEGEAAGRAAAEAGIEAQAAAQRSLRLAFRALDEAAMSVLADDLAATVLALCDQVLAECAVDREVLLARCHAAAARIGGAAEELVLHLHPDDIAMLGDGALGAWRLAPDTGLERGSVTVEGPDGAISDGPAEWRRAIAAALRG